MLKSLVKGNPTLQVQSPFVLTLSNAASTVEDWAGTVVEFVDLSSSDKKFYLLDTFEGLLPRYISPEVELNGITAGGYEPCYNEAVKTFSQFANCVIIVKVLSQARCHKPHLTK